MTRGTGSSGPATSYFPSIFAHEGNWYFSQISALGRANPDGASLPCMQRLRAGRDAHAEVPMRTSKLVMSVAIVLAACSSDHRPIAPSEPAFDKGAASPNTIVNLKASYSTFAATYFNDGRYNVPGAPDVYFTTSRGGEAPADLSHLNDCIQSWTTNSGSSEWTTLCLFRATGHVMFRATCGASPVYFQPPLPLPGVLIAYTSMAPFASYKTWIWRSPGQQVISTSVSNDVLLGDIPEPTFSTIQNTLLRAIPYPFGPGIFYRLAYLPHDMTTSDIPHDAGLWNLVWWSVLDPSRANHPACRGPDQETRVVIPFTETVNFVSTPSGNRNLIFSSSLGETALHYNANRGLTQGTGSLLSDDGHSFIDLSQFTGSTLPIIDQIMTGSGAHARACLVATPAQCTDVTLQRQ